MALPERAAGRGAKGTPPLDPETWRVLDDPALRKTYQERWQAYWEEHKEEYPGAP